MMKVRLCLILTLIGSLPLSSRAAVPNLASDSTRGAYYTGIYPNLFNTLLGKTDAEADARINSIFQQLFYGNDSTERVYYPAGTDMGYVVDILHNDVRTEGMSYGMMIAVQCNRKEEFDRIWKWAKTYMQHRTQPRKTYFAWHTTTKGVVIDSTAASDGEEWFVMSLFFASARWGNGEGIFNYKAQAQEILDAMLNKEGQPWSDGQITNMFNRKEKMVAFVPNTRAGWFTDPSYHLPHYYDLWGRWADKENGFWCEAASVSRRFFRKAAHPTTGLMSDYARFDGSPLNFGGGNNDFRFDAWRVGMNVALDYVWFKRDPWQIEQSNRLLNFFLAQGLPTQANQFTLDGRALSNDHSTGLMAMNAVAALASTDPRRKAYIQELWDTPTPSGIYRYYDSLLYLMAMLQVSGNFRIYDPSGRAGIECPGAAK